MVSHLLKSLLGRDKFRLADCGGGCTRIGLYGANQCNTRMTIASVYGSGRGLILTAQWLTQPILRLNQAAKAIAAGDLTNGEVRSPR